MSQLRRVFSGFAQSWTKPTMVPTPPETWIRFLMVLTRSSGVPMVEDAFSPPAVFSTASSGELNGCNPGRCSVATLYSLCHAITPAPRLAPSLLAALGDVPGQEHAPVGAAHGRAVLSRGVFGESPLRRQRHQ